MTNLSIKFTVGLVPKIAELSLSFPHRINFMRRFANDRAACNKSGAEATIIVSSVMYVGSKVFGHFCLFFKRVILKLFRF